MKSRSSSSAIVFILAATFLLLPWLPTIALAGQTTYSCKSVDVTTFPERVHVRCSTAASGGIIFFAVPRPITKTLCPFICGRTMPGAASSGC